MFQNTLFEIQHQISSQPSMLRVFNKSQISTRTLFSRQYRELYSNLIVQLVAMWPHNYGAKIFISLKSFMNIEALSKLDI